MYNKQWFNKANTNNKKVLHKIRKQGLTVSVALFALIGSGTLASHVNASANASNNSDNDTQSQTNSIDQLHGKLIAATPHTDVQNTNNNSLIKEHRNEIQPLIKTYRTNENSNNSNILLNNINHNNIQQNIYNKKISNKLNCLHARIIKSVLNSKKKSNRKIYYSRRIKHHNKYYQVSEGRGVHFTSQRGTDACEMASIKNVLSIHHKALRTPLWIMLNRLGWGGNWNRCYTGNPYTGHGVTISPWLEAKIIRRYGVHAHVHNYMSKKQMIYTLRRGHQLVIEAGHRCYARHLGYLHTPSDHILAIVGIKRNVKGLFVQYVDSDELTKRSGMKWCPFRRLWKSYNRPYITGDRAVVVTKNYRRPY